MTNIYSSYEAAIEAGAKGTDLVREECENCDKGNKPWFAHVHDGVCFQCHGRNWFTVQVRSIKARERRAAKRQAQQAEEIAAREEAIAARNEWNRLNTPLVKTIEELANVHKNRLAADLLEARDRIPTENQIAAILRIHRERTERVEIDVPEGRQTVTGKIISYKLVDNHFSYHGGTTVKILVEDPRGFRIYGTAPAALLNDRDADELKGTEVEFTATLEGKETGFGFFKRPAKAQFV
jgi:hypothetical protein